MTFPSDLLGRPPMRRKVEQAPKGVAPRRVLPSPVAGRVVVHLPRTMGELGEGGVLRANRVTLRAAPWQEGCGDE